MLPVANSESPTGYDHWHEFANSVDELNAFVRSAVLRKYQRDILNEGSFTVISPQSGRRVRVDQSVMLREGTAYLLPGGKTWLVTGPLQYGHPLWELVSENDGQRHPLPNSGIAGRSASNRQIERLRNARPPVATGHPTLVIGNSNFAHHLWNELSALDEWLSAATDEMISRLSVTAFAEPLGPLDRLFPKLGTVTDFVRQAPRSGCLDNGNLAVRVGARFVTERVRNVICGFCEQNAQQSAIAAARELLQDAWPRLWVSVRLGDRTIENQEDFIRAVMSELFHHFPEAAVLVDGFSYPFHFFEDPRVSDAQKQNHARRVRDNDAFIDHIIARLKNEFGERVTSRICSDNGLALQDAITLGRLCDYYICHAGSLQHKIGWLHNPPGLIHLPINTRYRALWHSDQIENGKIPDLLPAELLAPTTAPTQGPAHRRNPPRNFNYRVTNVEKAARYIVGRLQFHLRRKTADNNTL